MKGIPKIDVPEQTFYNLLHIKPVSMEHQELTQKILVRSSNRLAANIYPSRKDGGDKESFSILESAFYVLYVSKLRKSYNESGKSGLATVKGKSSGPLAWISGSTDSEFVEDIPEVNEEASESQSEVQNSELEKIILSKGAPEEEDAIAFIESKGALAIISSLERKNRKELLEAGYYELIESEE